MHNKTIRIIAPLPPKGSVAARHAGQVIHHLDKAGYDLRPATATGPSYCDDILKFAPKRLFDPMLERLLAEAPDTFILYPEALDFTSFFQAVWAHRRYEELRRIKLVWRLLWRAKRAVVVWRPRLLIRRDHLMIMLTAGLVKLFRPRALRLIRQSTPAEVVVQPLLGRLPSPCPPHEAEASSFALASRQGGTGNIRLTTAWLRASLSRLGKDHPLYGIMREVITICEVFDESRLPIFNRLHDEPASAPFTDRVATLTHGVPLSEFMLQQHMAKQLGQRFALANKTDCEAYLRWYITEASADFGHQLPLPAQSMLYFEAMQGNIEPQTPIEALRFIERNARFYGIGQSLGPKMRAYFNQPLTSNRNGLTRLELMVAALSHAPVNAHETLSAPWDSPELKIWFARLAHGGYPLLGELAALPAAKTRPGLKITGNAGQDTGLGQNMQMSVRALEGVDCKRPVFLHHVNADEIPAQMLKHHIAGAFHIGYLLWELETLPKAHQLAGELLDEIWVPTRFLQDIYGRAYQKPVIHIGKGFDLPGAEAFDLPGIGVQPGQNSFLISFDLHSSVARKNPLAAVLAFQMAFEGDAEKRLIIKTTKPPRSHWGDPESQMQIIRKIIARDSRIILLQAHLPFAQYLGLIEAVDALVSPHRAEGFGYLPAYAMKLGTPVIATDYGGTRDFCNKETALPVPWRRRNVRPRESIYPVRDAFWAEIDHEALAGAMQDVLARPNAARRRAAAGKALMQGYYSPRALRQRYLARLEELGLRA